MLIQTYLIYSISISPINDKVFDLIYSVCGAHRHKDPIIKFKVRHEMDKLYSEVFKIIFNALRLFVKRT